MTRTEWLDDWGDELPDLLTEHNVNITEFLECLPPVARDDESLLLYANMFLEGSGLRAVSVRKSSINPEDCFEWQFVEDTI